jgi:hypothetical protein
MRALHTQQSPTMIDISTQRNTLKELAARVATLRGYL